MYELFVLCLFVTLISVSRSEFNFQDECIQGCPFQNRTNDTLHFGVDCGFDCEVEQCSTGCRLWRNALESSCTSVCNGTKYYVYSSPHKLYCVIGCNYAVRRYIDVLRSQLGALPAPALVADSLQATSLSLEWSWQRLPTTDLSHIKYLVQWRYEESSAAWQYYRNQTWSSPDDTFFVDDLHPYTKYRFRVAVLLLPNYERGENEVEHVVSEPSVVISTLPMGAPASPPIIVRAVAVDSSRISISWEPGPFPNGPILSYVLQIVSSDHNPVLKDVPATNRSDFYVFKHLESCKNYTVSVAMRNVFGEGPAATTVVQTPSNSTVNQTIPIFILGQQYTVIQQSVDLSILPITLYKSSRVILGVAIHINYKLLFVSDEAGYVWQASLLTENYDTSTPKLIVKPDAGNSLSLDLSVDWLNDHLYILEEITHSSILRKWQITRCQLNGQGKVVTMAGFITKPYHIEVDPYNGYLFWVNNVGLWRLDLADSSNGVKHEISPQKLLIQSNLGAFTVDHTNFRIFIPSQARNTILSVSMDGREVIDVRSNTNKAMLQKVTSISMANGLFYWTNGDQVIAEEYNHPQDLYYHNPFSGFDHHSFIAIAINQSQPIPVPVNPPKSVQAVLGSTKAKVSWQIPHLLDGQGKGAWQNWSYELQVHNTDSCENFFYTNINSTVFNVNDLVENTEYVFKATAYTHSGRGPWSSEFRGRTLNISSNAKFIWSATEGLLWSDVIGDNVHTLLPSNNVYHVTDVAWYGSILYMVMSTSEVYQYDLEQKVLEKVVPIKSANCIAVDWIGKKLYWSNSNQQHISRGNLNGSQQETYLILALAKELTVDSVNAYIYWSSGFAVESARLNGSERRIYQPSQAFDGKQVMGLTIDIDQHLIYWIVRSSEGSILYRAPTAERINTLSREPIPNYPQHLKQKIIEGPLCFFSQRLLWLQDENNTVIGDLSGQNTAVLSGTKLNGLKMVTVMDESLHVVPGNLNRMNINPIPDYVNPQEIWTVGTCDAFNITWAPVKNVNYGQIFYEIKSGGNFVMNSSIITTENSIVFGQKVRPYSELEITVRAFTYWGSAIPSRTTIRSPQSTPSSPTSVRGYILFDKQPFEPNKVIGIFRWNSPVYPNGFINKYLINVWYNQNSTKIFTLQDVEVPASSNEFIHKYLLQNTTYYFQVRAYTVAPGEGSEVVEIQTDIENLPRLITATNDTIFIKDFDNNNTVIVDQSNGKVIDFTFLYYEHKVIWLNDLQEMFISNFDRSNRSKLLTLNGTGVSVDVNWIQRCVYWAQFDEDSQSSSIYSYDLNTASERIVIVQRIATVSAQIHKFQVSPLTNSLYWIETQPNLKQNHLKQSNLHGTKIDNFFQPGPNCNCNQLVKIGQTFTLQTNKQKEVHLLFTAQNSIVQADLDGCTCKTIHPFVSSTITSLSANSKYIYYLSKGNLFTNDNAFRNDSQTGIGIIKSFGSYSQIYPESTKCLKPTQVTLQPTLLKKASHSLILRMPELEPTDCWMETYTMPTVQYRVYYAMYKEGRKECTVDFNVVVNYKKMLKIHSLRPHKNYIFCLGVRNYYTGNDNVVLSEGIVFQTAAAAPSTAENVTAVVLNPNTIKVTWDPPTTIYDEIVTYAVHWRTEKPIAGIRQNKEFETSTKRVALLQNLVEKNTYSIFVRTHSPNSDTYKDSETIQVETYPEPNNITIENITAYSVELTWNKSDNITLHVLRISKVGSNNWIPVNDSVDGRYKINGLEPKTKYDLKLSLKYFHFEELYVWPNDDRFKFRTLGDKPSAPGRPIMEYVRGDVYRVTWELANDHGSPIHSYQLEVRTQEQSNSSKFIQRRESERASSELGILESYSIMQSSEPYVDEDEVEFDWKVFYNGTENYWLISDLVPEQTYWFRVAALNDYGLGPYSEVSNEFQAGVEAADDRLVYRSQQLTMLMAIIVPVLVIVCLISVCCLFCVCKKGKVTKVPPPMTPIATLRPDLELATLRDMPRGRPGGNFVHSTNILYTSSDLPLSDSPEALPHIKRDQITLTKFLGSGAFGEVFEGKAKSLSGIQGETRVAVKTLRKGASAQERAEFLREAQLMAHFKHKHILKLLGVCRDNDPHFIIMELMQAGDLLSYLRMLRPLPQTHESLTLRDLIEMCVDVAKGCCYLEEQHFVHRDLACRNCLVSSSDRATRVVKIGDFGLARDIYKNDYYRKEGEGLLPVRWMAPESLVDGVFTSQSDVWAFGVLMWEIMTYGQQPYPARTNLEVLHYVRNGGRLHRPNDCPEDLHQLMLKCWSYNPETRPTFKYCLEVLKKLKQDVIQNTVQLTQRVNSETAHFNFANPCYMLDYNSNISSGETRPENSTSVPKYLELLYDDEQPQEESLTCVDGYEIPRSSLRSTKSATIRRPTSLNHPYRHNSLVNRRSNSITAKRPAHPPIIRSHSLVQKPTDSVFLQTFKGVQAVPAEAELLTPSSFKKSCTYSNIAQAQKPLLTEIPPVEVVRRNSHSIC